MQKISTFLYFLLVPCFLAAQPVSDYQQFTANKLDSAEQLYSSGNPNQALELIKTTILEGSRSKQTRSTQRSVIDSFGHRVTGLLHNILQQEKDNPTKIEANTSLGRYWGVLHGNWSESTRYYKKALELKPDKIACQTLYRNIGNNYFQLKQYDRAIQYSERALSVGGEAQPAIYKNLAVMYQAARQYNQAEVCAERALEHYRQKPDKQLATVPIYNVIASVSLQQQQLEKALRYYQEALTITDNMIGKESPQSARQQYYLGIAHFRNKNENKAFRAFEKAIDIYQKFPPEERKNNIFKVYNKIAVLFEQQGKFRLGEEYHQKALNGLIDWYGSTKEKNVARAYTYLARNYKKQKDYPKALSTLETALEIQTTLSTKKDPLLSEIHLEIGRVHFLVGQYQQATEAFELALKTNSLGDHRTDSSSTDYLDARLLIVTLSVYANCYFRWYEQTNKEDFLLKAYQYITKANKVSDQVRRRFTSATDKSAWHGQFIIADELLIKTALELYQLKQEEKYLRQALNIAQENKSSQLLETLNTNTALHFGEIPDSLAEHEQQLVKGLILVENQLLQAKQNQDADKISKFQKILLDQQKAIQDFELILETQFPKYYQLKYAPLSISTDKLQAQLDPQTALIEFFVGPNEISIFTLTSEKLFAEQIPSPTNFADEIQLLRSHLTNALYIAQKPEEAREKYIDFAHRLYQLLLEPSLKKLPDVRRLIIIPDADLSYIPFEALLDKRPSDDEHYDKFSYLLRRYTISYSYSARLLIAPSHQDPPAYPGQMLALAADYGLEYAVPSSRNTQLQNIRPLDPLPGALEEVTQLAALIEGRHYYNKDANEQNFKQYAQQYDILHLATHGIVDKYTPLTSGLALTENGDQQEDNMLYAYEISHLRLNARLVVLSACETGYGKFEQGEGVMSIGRSFMYAGVPSLVVSLWRVNDRSTAMIMESFYKNLSSGMRKDEALQKAKLTYISEVGDRYAHPNFWAAFVQLGNQNTIKISPKSGLDWWVWAVIGLGVAGILGLGWWKFR